MSWNIAHHPVFLRTYLALKAQAYAYIMIMISEDLMSEGRNHFLKDIGDSLD